MRVWLTIGMIFLAAVPASLLTATSADGILGGSSIELPSEKINFSQIPRDRFPAFVEQSVRRFLFLGPSFPVTPLETGYPSIQDMQVQGRQKCLDPSLRGSWQRFVFEVMYVREDGNSTDADKRYKLIVRIISGEFAEDFDRDENPPPDRIRQYSRAELTDMGRRFAGRLRKEIGQSCFDKTTLQFCPAATKEICG